MLKGGLKFISYIGLALTLIPSILVFTKSIEFNTHVNLMLLGTVLWFITRPFWTSRNIQD